MATISNHRVGQSPLRDLSRDHSAKTGSEDALVFLANFSFSAFQNFSFSHDLPGFVEAPATKDKFTRLVPVYSLEAAAGKWGPESTPKEIGWAEAPNIKIKPGMFIARVRGRSMEPKIKDGSWNLFRPCPAGSREGRIVLVQFNSLGDPENGGRFTVKKYHSAKSVTEDGWRHERIELLPLNPDNDPIIVKPHEGTEMVVVGEFVASI